MLEQLAAHRDWLEELDPGRPTWVVLYQVDQVRAYLPTFDVIGTDPYPIPMHSPSRALDWARKTVDGVFHARPVWMVPQIFNWAAYKNTPEEKQKCRAPTLAEMRSMAWQCIAGGANGLIFYSWFDLWRMDKDTASGGRAAVREPFEQRWQEVCQMAAEIKQFMPVLLATEPHQLMAKFEGPAAVAHRTYGHRGATWLLLVNSELTPAEVTCHYARTIRAATGELGPKEIKTTARAFSLKMAPLEVRLIQLQFDAQGKGR
jgi:hypothetical protein